MVRTKHTNKSTPAPLIIRINRVRDIRPEWEGIRQI